MNDFKEKKIKEFREKFIKEDSYQTGVMRIDGFVNPEDIESFISTLIDEVEALHCACMFRKQESEEDKNTLIESCKFHSNKLNETRKETIEMTDGIIFESNRKNSDQLREFIELMDKLKNQEDFTTDERGWNK